MLSLCTNCSKGIRGRPCSQKTRYQHSALYKHPQHQIPTQFLSGPWTGHLLGDSRGPLYAMAIEFRQSAESDSVAMGTIDFYQTVKESSLKANVQAQSLVPIAKTVRTRSSVKSILLSSSSRPQYSQAMTLATTFGSLLPMPQRVKKVGTGRASGVTRSRTDGLHYIHAKFSGCPQKVFGFFL